MRRPHRPHPPRRLVSAVGSLILLAAGLRLCSAGHCGADLDDASNCWQVGARESLSFCQSGISLTLHLYRPPSLCIVQTCEVDDDCCGAGVCFPDADAGCPSPADLSGPDHYFCGATWCEAAYTCGTPCPETTECPEGQGCFADVPCGGGEPAPPLPSPPTSAPTQFCGEGEGGEGLSDAKGNCWQPCPRGDKDCCFGLTCHDTSQDGEIFNLEESSSGTCPASSLGGNMYCGSSWCDAAYTCGATCPGGTNEECPAGQYCYNDIPCAVAGETPPEVTMPPPSYCGDGPEDAASSCWAKCTSDSDCCFGQTCFEVEGGCEYVDHVGPDHYFCGSDFCEAAFTCPLPCPGGVDSECDEGQRCYAGTPCNANTRSITPGETVRYGLPLRALELIRRERPGGGFGGAGDVSGGEGPDLPSNSAVNRRWLVMALAQVILNSFCLIALE